MIVADSENATLGEMLPQGSKRIRRTHGGYGFPGDDTDGCLYEMSDERSQRCLRLLHMRG